MDKIEENLKPFIYQSSYFSGSAISTVNAPLTNLFKITKATSTLLSQTK